MMPRNDLPRDVRALLETVPDLAFVEAFVIDINGIARGKRLPAASLPGVYAKGLNLPVSTPLLDVWGREVEGTGLALASGDADRLCHPVAHGVSRMPWRDRPAAQILMMMHEADGTGFAGDPRAILARVLERLTARGLIPVVATELEFRLFEAETDAAGAPRPARLATRPGRRSQLYGIDELESLDALFNDIEAACALQGLPMDTLIAEQGAAQYEINLLHGRDALRAADQTVLLKRTIKACARRHGLTASFMAKPIGDAAGNGFHVHASLENTAGDNVYAGGLEDSPVLGASLAGLLDTMPDAMAVFAPHENSYRRFQADCHVPLAPNWGFDNRTAALRLPLASAAATRIEHRVAGADANPYLVLAAVLGGIVHGLDNDCRPPAPIAGEAPADPSRALPDAWGDALDRFEHSAFAATCFGAEYRPWYTAVKRQERARLRAIVPAAELDAYLHTV